MTENTNESTPQGEVISDAEIQLLQEALGRYGYADPKAVRDHYSPRKLNGATCIGFQGDNPAIMALELCAVLAARVIATEDADRDPAEHESTFLDHLDYLREAAAKLGELGVDRLLENQVWFWPELVCETAPTRQQLVEDVRAQVESEVAKRAEALVRQGYDAGWHAAMHPQADPGARLPGQART